MIQPLIEENIEALKQVSENLSRLSKGATTTWDNIEGPVVSMEALSPIVENLNTVIQDLKNCIGRNHEF